MGLRSSWPWGPVWVVHSTWCSAEWSAVTHHTPSHRHRASGKEGGGDKMKADLGFCCLGNQRCHLSCMCWSTSCSSDIVLIHPYSQGQTDLLVKHVHFSLAVISWQPWGCRILQAFHWRQAKAPRNVFQARFYNPGCVPGAEGSFINSVGASESLLKLL